MLKRRIIKKISISTAALFAIFLICLIPDKSYDIDPNREISYVNSNVVTSNIYLLDKNNRLGRTSVVISSVDTKDIAMELLEILISGGVGESLIPSGFRSFLPSDTVIKSIKVTDNIINVDFSKELLDISKDKEVMIIEAITYSLTEIEGIDSVTIYIEGVLLKTLPKTNTLVPPIINRDFGINKVYDINSLDNVNHVTTYFIDKNNDSFYYVPVTKYVNDDREKISIIIDELTSSNIYNTDLMSFLNSNTELLSVQKEDDVIKLIFNNYILNNFDKKDILEEVIYTICLSIKDNYNVNEVIFNAFDEEIYKSVLKTIE